MLCAHVLHAATHTCFAQYAVLQSIVSSFLDQDSTANSLVDTALSKDKRDALSRLYEAEDAHTLSPSEAEEEVAPSPSLFTPEAPANSKNKNAAGSRLVGSTEEVALLASSNAPDTPAGKSRAARAPASVSSKQAPARRHRQPATDDATDDAAGAVDVAGSSSR